MRQELILGTAQWTGSYGVSPSPALTKDDILVELLATAKDAGIGMLDTAPSYGDAEMRIGHLGGDFRVQTKVHGTRGSVAAQLDASRRRIGDANLHTILVHDWRHLDQTTRASVAHQLEQIRGAGNVERVGVSCYYPYEIDYALEAFERLDVVQVPVNILDQRFKTLGEAAMRDDTSPVIQARSVFLQGLLLESPTNDNRWSHPDLQRLVGLGFGEADQALEVCLRFLTTCTWTSEVVIGVNSKWQLERITRGLTACLDSPSLEFGDLASTDLALIDPTQW